MIRFKKVTQQTVLLLTIGLLAPLHGAGESPGDTDAKKTEDRNKRPLKRQRLVTEAAPVAAAQGAPANGGAGAEPAVVDPFCLIGNDLHRTTTSYLSASDQAAFAGASKYHHQSFMQKLAEIKAKLLIPAGIELTDEEKKVCALYIFKTQQKAISKGPYAITLPWAMKQLTTATAANHAAEIATLNRIVKKFINEHHAPYRIAFHQADASLDAEADLTNARALLAAIPAEDLLNRMALCFVWNIWFPEEEDLDINIPLKQIISRSEDHSLLSFEIINQVDNQETLAQEIVNFVLTLMRPRTLRIYSARGALAFVSYKLQILAANTNPLLTALDISNCPQLQELGASYNSLLTALDLSNCPQLQILGANTNPLLTALDLSNCPHLQKLYADNNPLLTALDLSGCPQLQTLQANNNSLLTALDLSNCPHLQQLYASYNPLLTALDLSGCPHLQRLQANNNHWLTDLSLPPATPLLSAGQRTTISGIVAANRARIAAEEAEADGNVGFFHRCPIRRDICAIQ